MTPADVLRKAADYIEVHGWTQGNYYLEGRCCADGAIQKVAEHPGHRQAAREALRAALPRPVRLEGCPVLNWNDQPHRTAEEVIATLRTVAARLDSHPDRDRGEGER